MRKKIEKYTDTHTRRGKSGSEGIVWDRKAKGETIHYLICDGYYDTQLIQSRLLDLLECILNVCPPHHHTASHTHTHKQHKHTAQNEWPSGGNIDIPQKQTLNSAQEEAKKTASTAIASQFNFISDLTNGI